VGCYFFWFYYFLLANVKIFVWLNNAFPLLFYVCILFANYRINRVYGQILKDMNNFIFKNPTKIIFGRGAIAKLATEIPLDKRVMITLGGGSVKENGVYSQVKDALSAHFTVEFWGIEPNPEYETLLNAVEVAEQNEIDFLLAVGGGSVLDGTKFIAQAIGFDQEPWNLVRNPRLTRPSLPVASVMTLPATGSEMNHRSVISYRAKKEKLAFMSEHLYPLFSILDPEVTYSLPDRQISNGLVDSFMHVMEQYMTYPVNALVMDRWAEGILQTLIEISGQVLTNRTDYDVMSNYMMCATLALNDFIGMGVPQDWAAHRIGHELTAVYGLDHGQALAVIYPALLRVMKAEKREKLLQYAVRVWKLECTDPDSCIDQVIDQTENFFRSVGMHTRLHEYQIGSDAVGKITDRVRQRGLVYGENQSVTPEVVECIISSAL